MKLPIQAKPVLRVIGETVKLNGEDAVKAATRPNCYLTKNCQGNPSNHKDYHNCKNFGGKSWQAYDGAPCQRIR